MAKKLTFKAPSSWNRETLTPQQERQMVQDSSTAWNAARTSDNGKRSLQQIQAGAQAASPGLASRVGNVVSGAAKSTGAGFTNLGGTLFDLLHRADTKIGQANANVKANQDLKTADRYRAMLERGTLENGAPLTNETRRQLESLVKQYESRSGLYQRTNERIQAPITEDVQSVYDTADRLAAESAEDIEAAKQGTGAVGRFLVDAGVAGTQLAGDALLSALIPGAGLASMAARSAGSGAQQARQEGADLGQQVAYGLGSGLLSVATERITNLAGPFRRAFGSGVLDDALSRLPGKLSQSAAGRTVLSAIGEGGEEVVEDLVQPLLQRITYDESATQQYQDPEFLANTLYDGLIGATLGGLGGGVDIAQSAIRSRRAARQEAAGATEANGAVSQDTQGQQGGTEAPDLMSQEARRLYSQNASAQASELEANTRRNPGETIQVVETLKRSIPQMTDTNPVSTVSSRSVLSMSGRTMAEKARKLFEAIKGTVTRPGFGDIDIDTRSIKDDLHHGIGTAKAAVIPTIPEIIRNGTQIDYQQNWKGRPYDGYIFAAPVNMDGNTVYVAAVVKRTSKNRFYLHEVVDSDGNIIKINDGDRANPTSLAANGDAGTQSPPSSIRTTSTSDGTSALSGDLDTVVDTGDSSGLSVPQGGGNVNQDPLLQILTGGRRVDQARLTQDQFDAAVAANERGTVGMDAAGRVYQVDPEQHIDRRDAASIRDRRVNAFQYDHPELQPYYRQAAETLMRELNGAIRGGQTETATGEYGQTYSWRTRRNATDRISGLLDGGMSYARIEAALDAIIQDKGRENNADAKRVEMVIDDMLTNGYRDSSGFISPSQDYINAKSTITGAVPAEQRGYLDGVDSLASDGLGAADAGSINTDYDRLQAQSSRFYPEGANAARPVDVPTTDFQGNPISRSASTVMGARSIPDDVIPQIEQMIADGQLSYQQNTDRASLERATQNVQNKGFDGALEEFRSAVRSGKISKDIATLGQALLNTAANNRDGNAVAEILSLYQTMNTNVGQSLQAMSIFRKLSPESQLYGIRRTVDNLNKKIQEINKNFQGVQIDPELLTRFTEQTDQTGRDAVMQEIYQNVADQVPSTWRDKWNAWRYLAMLGNPRTHVRNIVGNVGFQPLRFVKNEVAAGIESALSAAGVNIERTKSFGANPALYRAAWRDYENVSDVLGGSKYDDASSQVNQRRRIFSNRFLEAARKFNTRSMELEDVVFKRITYADSLAQYLQANGVTAAQLESGQVDSGLMQRARDYAGQEALKATYQDRNAISDRVVKIVRDAGPVGDAIMPFKRTPANILARGLEYSPAGLAKSIYDGLRTVTGKSDKTATQVIDEAAAGLTGSALMALGAYLFSEGLVTGAQGDDKDDEWAELLGHQGYALELPNGTSVTLDWLAPESMPFFMGVELASSMGENGMDANAVTDALKAIANPMLELSMLQSVNDLIDSVAYAEEAPLSAMIPSAIISYFSQAIPTLGGQIERTSESDRMTTYTDKNSEIPTDVQYAIGRASSRIPGIDLFQTPYIDAWGRTESSGDVLTRALNNFVNPAYSSQVDVDAVEQELQKVRDATGETSVFPSRAQRYIEVNGARKDLSAEEYQTYATTKGQTSYDLVSEAIRLPEYRSMSDGEKAEYISDLYSYANAVAKQRVSAYELEGWQLNAQTAREDLGVSPAEYIALYQKYGSRIMSGQGYDKTKQAVNAGLTVQQYAEMKSGLDADGNDSVSQAEAKSYLDRQDYSRELKSDLWNIINKSWKTNPYA